MLRVLILPLLKINRWNREKSRAETGYLEVEKPPPPLDQAARQGVTKMDLLEPLTGPTHGRNPKARRANAHAAAVGW
jgi:hypothetical protein